MKEYTITLKSISDIFALKKIAKKYQLTGSVQQGQLNVKMNSTFGLLMSLPLDHATLTLDEVKAESLPFAEKELKETLGKTADMKPRYV